MYEIKNNLRMSVPQLVRLITVLKEVDPQNRNVDRWVQEAKKNMEESNKEGK